ncbi:hypothetical protein LARV_00915 [Longilinea arvoryzae]|uniref:DUF4238 domain-containing protein n=1 Tax=Longilinea arvoryzae TaxID=360412 RepID=A0A0S7B760_9CHLR|nr:DUF4238 domain-containing protein [Longilinea arvoryzae]GAP13164.1 hypothetical protein LARV_00915 [Longilinea arvoryzae]
MNNKRQHYIPTSYLKSWCDPTHPRNQKPYVWMFSKDGSIGKRKSPKKIFYEKDLYTIRAQDNNRDLTLEYNLSRIENKFFTLRKEKISKHLMLSFEEHLYLCMFVAAMHGRTPSYASELSSVFNQALCLGKKMIEWAKENPPNEQQSAVIPIISSEDQDYLTMEEMEEIVNQPLQSLLSSFVTKISPILFHIPFVFIEIPESVDLTFLTSDTPCVFFDPEIYSIPRPRFAGGLVSPTIEITLPISPRMMVLFSKMIAVHGSYIQLPDKKIIDLLNRKTRLFSREYFINNSNALRKEWF